MEHEAEINRIKRDLVILQSRYAQYRRIAGILKAAFTALMPLSVIGALALAVKLFLFDTLYGVFFVTALLIFVPAIIWLIKSTEVHWIDLAASPLRGIYHPDFLPGR
jgi:hypothetical protein